MAPMKKRLARDRMQTFMKRTVWFLLPFNLIFLLGSGVGQASLRNPFVEGLKIEGYELLNAAVYDKENVFDYINGEADVYFPFGFQYLYVLQLKKALGGAQTILEAYDMANAKGARGIFKQYTQDGGEAIQGLGDGAWSDKTILLFHRGRFFLRIWPDDSVGKTHSPNYEDLLELSRLIDAALTKGVQRSSSGLYSGR